MKPPSYPTVVCAIAAVAVLVVGVPAFDAHDTNRGLETSTTTDDRALLGVSVTDPVTIHGEEETTPLEVTNQFTDDLETVNATIDSVRVGHGDEDLSVQVERTPDGLVLGTTGEITVMADGDENTTAIVVVRITAAGSNESTRLTREFELHYWSE